MLTSVRSLLAAAALTGGALLATPALAEDGDNAKAMPFTVSGNVSGVTDYRFRGYSLTGGDPAIQGSINVSHSSGFYVGAWGSSLDAGPLYGPTELDLYAGWAGQVTSGLKLDAGVLAYTYPSNELGPADIWEPYASLAFTLGPATAKLGGAYAWKQASLGNQDNLYLYSNVDVGVPTTPVTVSGHLGYSDGALTGAFLAGGADHGFDWSLGASATVLGHLTLGIAYVGVEGPSIKGFTDDTVVGTLTLSL